MSPASGWVRGADWAGNTTRVYLKTVAIPSLGNSNSSLFSRPDASLQFSGVVGRFENCATYQGKGTGPEVGTISG